MTKEQVIQLLTELNIQPNDGRGEVDDKISEKKLYRKVKVSNGAFKTCLIFKDDTPFVIKWSQNEDAIKEVDIYNSAKAEKLDMFFPVTEHFASINEVEFVLQEKVDSCEYDLTNFMIRKYKRITKTALNKTVDQMEKEFWKADYKHRRDLSNLWAKMVIVIYGKRMCKKLCEFVIKNRINDLHRCNIGFIKNKPVILDFSGCQDE